jgi:GGDEF domain-containing protein
MEDSSLLTASASGIRVQSRTWEWLAALRQPLNIDLQLVDTQAAGGVVPVAARGPVDLSRLIDARSPVLRATVSTTVRTGEHQVAIIDGVQIVTSCIKVADASVGALLVARSIGGRDDVAVTREELETIAAWLRPAIEAHLISGPAIEAAGLEKLSALGRVLAPAVAHASDRDIVAAFAEVMAVWHDVDTHGYVEIDDGTFRPEVLLPGIDRASVPPAISPASLPANVDASRVVEVDCESIGMIGSETVHVARLASREGARSWLLLLSGPIPPDIVSRVRAYMTLLEQWLTHAGVASVSRVITAMSAALIDDDEYCEASGTRALSQLLNVLRMRSAVWTVNASDGTPLLRVAEHRPGRYSSDAVESTSVRRTSRGLTMTLVVVPGNERRVTPQENDALESAADLMAHWSRRLLPEMPHGERRSTSRQFDQLLESIAKESMQRGSAVSLIMLSLPSDALGPSNTNRGAQPATAPAAVARRWVREIRTHLRPADLVGLLTDREIAVLLQDAPDHHAQAVAQRLRNLVTTDANTPAAPHPLLGFVSWAPGDPVPDALVQHARQKAFQRDVA